MKFTIFTLLFVLLLSCADNPIDPTIRFPGAIAPCDVVSDGSHEPYEDRGFEWASQDAADEIWRDGPYPIWSTSPDDACNADPTIPFVGEETIKKDEATTIFVHENVKMYITYPAISEPTVTGDGRVADGLFPVVIFAHANSDRQCDIYRDYWSMHDHWASWGFVTVAIDGTDLNCKRGTRVNMELRQAGQVNAVDALTALNEDPDSIFFERLDMTKVIFAGHSRGGGSSLLAQRETNLGVGAMTIQGVDLTAFGFGAATLPDFPVLGLTAGEDVDLNYPHTEPTEDMLGGEYTWVNINGGIHAYSADGAPIEPDDVPLITREQQHNVTDLYSTAFLGKIFGLPTEPFGEHQPFESASVLANQIGAEIVDEKISDLGVYVRWRTDATEVLIDNFNSPIDGNSADENEIGGANSFTGFSNSAEVSTYKPTENKMTGMYAKSYSLHLTGAGTFATTAGDTDITTSTSNFLQFRIKGPDDGSAPTRVSVLVETTSGSETVDAYAYSGPEALKNRFAQVSIPLDVFSGGEVSITSISIETDGGELFVDDLRIVEQE